MFHAKDKDNQTLLLIEFDQAMKDVTLPHDGRIRLDISDEQIVFMIHQFGSPLHREKVTIADLMSRSLLPSSSKDFNSFAPSQFVCVFTPEIKGFVNMNTSGYFVPGTK